MAILPPVRVFMILTVYIFSRFRLLLQYILSYYQRTSLLGISFPAASWYCYLLGGGEQKKKNGGGNERARQCMHCILIDCGLFLEQEGCVWNKGGRGSKGPQKYSLEVFDRSGKGRSGSWAAENK